MIDLLFIKLIKFAVVGFSGMLIDFGFTWILKEKAKWNQYLANSMGFILAASSNYVWNRIWTFDSQSQQISREYFSFFLISLIGLAINNLLIYWLLKRMKINFYVAKLFAILVVTLWNFGMNLVFTFSAKL